MKLIAKFTPLKHLSEKKKASVYKFTQSIITSTRLQSYLHCRRRRFNDSPHETLCFFFFSNRSVQLALRQQRKTRTLLYTLTSSRAFNRESLSKSFTTGRAYPHLEVSFISFTFLRSISMRLEIDDVGWIEDVCDLE